MRKLVLWGHDANDYCGMFDLTLDELKGRVFEYGCGPSAINATLHGQSELTVSCDSLFALDKPALEKEVTAFFEGRREYVAAHLSEFEFTSYGSFEALIKARQAGLRTFFDDYDVGREEKRYVAELPPFSYSDLTFDYALSSHFLFTDVDNQTVESHLEVIKSLARIAQEVRIFPLIDRHGQTSQFLGPVLLGLQQANFGTELREISYRLQPTGNVMLRVWPQVCQLP